MTAYDSFLATKRLVAPPVGIPDPPELAPMLFPFQRDITHWALRRGRAALWLDCGLGKTPCAIEWSRVVAAHTGKPVLILTPLAVAQQFVTEGEKFGSKVKLCRDHSYVEQPSDDHSGVNVTNYDRLEKFDVGAFGGVVLDESSILKDYTSATRNALISSFAETPFRLCCTATPAPNDHVELGNHAEFLGVMTRTEMLSMFFCHDGGETQTWRLKGHAQRDFWRWVCSWAVNLRKPSDLGYSDEGYDLPPLIIHEHVVKAGAEYAQKMGTLFAMDAHGLTDQRAARRASLEERVMVAAQIANAEPDEHWLAWCDLNAESQALTSAITGAIEVTGSMPTDLKERLLAAYVSGEMHALVSKPSIAGYGLNLQHCARVLFVGLSNSFEAWYQAIRRTWRCGQTREVHCHVITSEAEGAVVANLKRKQADSEKLSAGMVEHMAEITRAELGATGRTFVGYNPEHRIVIPHWLVGGP